ncbi:aminobutyraldehyde dehydrogenase [Kribbella catacumbae]|uniref:aminobutyraldehyde dehydrogenase n=1 Tax=Kribbella catacumbae TaxID=460086 RepID=UPI000364527E|nr:aminobutyraldehyde dehydrogenase [Kribbella catacumbae]
MIRNVIDGQLCEAKDGRVSDVVDPSTGKSYDVAALSGEVDVAAAYAAATRAFATWRRTTPAERQKALLGLADALEARSEELVAAEVANTGKPVELTRTEEIAVALDQLRFFAGAARSLEGAAAGEYLAGHTSYVRREPVGVIGQVTPWNYPFMMAIWKVAPALAAGNTVVLKPSDTTPATASLLGEIAADVLPPGVLNVVCGDRDTGRLVVSHPDAAMVSITGSTAAGKAVATSAAADVKRVHLELGGKAPVLVFADTDLTATVEGVVSAGLFNAGQDCTAATRVLVQEQIAEQFQQLLVEAVSQVRTGPPSDHEALYGPLNNVHQFERVSAVVDSIGTHATVLIGGHRVGTEGYFYAPTVVGGVRQDDAIVQQETFGPVLTVQTFRTEAEAVQLANDVDLGLAASVWTTDHGTAHRCSIELDFGCVWVNTHIPLVAEMPHGGFKQSGYGKDLSHYGLEDYTRVKHVMHSHG